MKFKVCPQCGSENIEWIIPQNWSQWSCNDCSYTGLVIEVDKDTQKEIQKEWKETGRIISSKDDDEDDKVTCIYKTLFLFFFIIILYLKDRIL